MLKKYDVDYKEYTAGEFKRTVSLFGEVTEKGEKKFLEQLEETHTLFKSFVHRYRPQLELAQIATGEHWFGEQALKLGLIDAIKTSDDYLLELSHTHQVLKINYEEKKPWNEKYLKCLASQLGIFVELWAKSRRESSSSAKSRPRSSKSRYHFLKRAL